MANIKAFASHDWGKDGDNHKRVAEVVTRLKAEGIDVWFDEFDMHGNVLQSMCNGIDGSDVVLVFVTSNYVSKVQSANDLDNVKREFMYASQTKPGCILPIRFEEALPRVWKGPVGMILGCNLYNDLRIVDESTVKVLAASIRKKVCSNAWKQTSRECLLKTAMTVTPAPVTTRKPLTVRARVREARDLLGLTVNESDHTSLLVDRLFDSVVGNVPEESKKECKDGLCLMEKLNLVEIQLGITR